MRYFTNLAFLILFSTMLFSGCSEKSNNIQRHAPRITGVFEDLKPGVVTRDELLKARIIKLESNDLTKEVLASYIIEGFTFAIAPKHGSSYIEPTKGSELTSYSIKRFEVMMSGDMVVIANIQIINPQGTLEMAAGTTYTLAGE